MKWAPIEKDVLRKLYVEQKLSAHKIAKIYNVKPYQIYYLLEKYGIDRRAYTEMNTQYSVNHNFFECIDSAEKAYWLGFFYADGYITVNHHVGLALAQKDIDHIKKFRDAISSTHPIHIYPGSNYGKAEYARINFSSSKMAKDLECLGCIQHKSLQLKFPTKEQVPEQFLRDFVRGYFDGDGCITTGGKNSPLRIKVCGTKEFLESLRNYFNAILAPDKVLNKLEKRHKDEKNNYLLCIASLRKSLLILHALYKNATVFLERKNNLYLKNAQIQSSLPEMVGV